MSTRTFGVILFIIGIVIISILQMISFESMNNQFDSIVPPNPDSQWNRSVNPDLPTGSSLLSTIGNVVGFIFVILGIIYSMRDSLKL